jgi:hypothetical protein
MALLNAALPLIRLKKHSYRHSTRLSATLLTFSTYNKAQLLPERTKMMQEWADYLDTLRVNQAIQGNGVIPAKAS